MRTRLVLFTVLAVLAASLVTGQPAAAAAPAGFTDSAVAGLSSPTGLAFTPDGRLLVSSQRGQIRVVKNGALLPTPAISLAAKICTNSERGVLGLATDPDPASRAVYVFYTARGSDSTCPVSNGVANTAGMPRNRVSKFTLGTDDLIDPASEVVLVDGIYSTGGFHNAGDLHVGHDGYLYIATGDGGCDYLGDSGCGSVNNASRDRNVLNGKILRITTSGGVPADNPFTGTGTASCRLAPAAAGQICQEAFAWGLRNPFRMGFDPNATGTVFRINDVGQSVWEEVDQGVKGADYGWNGREGHCQHTDSETSCGTPTPASMTDPIYDYPHSTTVGGLACGSITGGAYVPNGVWPAAYSGAYLFSDYVCGAIFSLSPSLVRSTVTSGLGASSAVAMVFGPDGATQSLYYTSYAGGGEVRKLAYTGTGNRAPTAAVKATPDSGPAPLLVRLDGSASADADGDALSYRWAFGDGAPDQTTTTPTVDHRYAGAGTFTATLTVTDPGGLTGRASTTVRPGATAPTVTITAPTAGDRFSVGGSYRLTGTATDPQDGPLPDSALSWTVVKHHAEHTHPFLGPVSGNDITITGPAPEDLTATTNSYLEIRLTATDSAGVSTTVTRDFKPATVPVTLATSPVNRKLTVNGNKVSGPTTVTSWQDWPLQLAVPAQADGNGVRFEFQSWSDGGASSHAYLTPATASTVTATLVAASATPSSPSAPTVRQATASSATISWDPPSSAGGSAVTGYRVARDGTDSAGEGAYATTVSPTTRTFTMTRLVPGRIYTLSVAAVNAYGTGPVAAVPVTVLGASSAGAPTNVTVRSSATDGSARISWDPPAATGGAAITGYRVSRDGVDSQGVAAYATTVAASATTSTLTQLVAGRTYTLSVQAITSAGFGAPAGGGVVPSSTTAVGSPAGLTVRSAAAGQATVSWAPAVKSGGQTVTGYRVSRDGVDSQGVGDYSTVVAGSVRSATLTRLVPGQVYTVTVQPVISGSGPTPAARTSILIG